MTFRPLWAYLVVAGEGREGAYLAESAWSASRALNRCKVIRERGYGRNGHGAQLPTAPLPVRASLALRSATALASCARICGEHCDLASRLPNSHRSLSKSAATPAPSGRGMHSWLLKGCWPSRPAPSREPTCNPQAVDPCNHQRKRPVTGDSPESRAVVHCVILGRRRPADVSAPRWISRSPAPWPITTGTTRPPTRIPARNGAGCTARSACTSRGRR